jgi:type II secretory pathway component GspD/PulD (secretin)
MKAILTAIVILLVGIADAADEAPRFLIVAKDTPISTVVSNYARHSGISVVVAPGVTGVVNIAQDGPITRTEYLRRTAAGMEEVNVGLYPNGTNGLIAKWIGPTNPPPSPPPHKIKPFVSSESSEARAEREKAFLEQLRSDLFKSRKKETPANKVSEDIDAIAPNPQH